MTPEEALIEKLKAAGIDEALLTPLNPEQLVAFAALADKAMGAPPPPEPAPEGGEEAATDNAEFPEGQTRESIIAELAGMGEDPAALNGMDDAALMALWQEKKGATMSEPVKTAAAPPPAPAAPPVPAPPAREPNQVVLKYAEQVERLQKQATELGKQYRRRLAEERKAEARAFCERQVREGRLLPAELEDEVETALALDAVTVRKFSDGFNGTAFDRWKRRLERRPKHNLFNEKMSQGKGGVSKTEAETDKVRRFSEDPKFARTLRAAGKSPEAYVAGFQKIREKMPAVTAEDYGVPADFE